MREIKFRGRDEYGKWHYGAFMGVFHDGVVAPIEYANIYADGMANRVFLETVGQFTGLLDTARKEIYEGDIVVVKEDGEESRHVVRYMNDEDYPAFDLVPESMSWCGECNGLSYCMIHMDAAIYVIGNFYDNPELLLEAHA